MLSSRNSGVSLIWKYLNENGRISSLLAVPGREDPGGSFFTNPFIIEGPGWLVLL